MDIRDVLREIRSVQLPGLDVTMNAWADAIEAEVTREPVAWQNTKSPSIIVTNDTQPKYMDEWTPLFAFPPDAAGEIERSHAAIRKANAQAEHFEREWYLRGDEIEKLTGLLLDVLTTKQISPLPMWLRADIKAALNMEE